MGLGYWLAPAAMGAAGADIYAFLNRLPIPTGLHHALNNVFWFDTIGLTDLIFSASLPAAANTLVDEKKIRSSGASGVIRPGKTSVQVVIGTKVQFVHDEFRKLI